MRILANSWNAYLEELQYDMKIIRVPEDTLYRIFFVSDNRFADGNRYPEFLEMLSRHFLGAGFSFAIYGMRTGTLSLGMNTVYGGRNKPLDYLLPRALHK